MNRQEILGNILNLIKKIVENTISVTAESRLDDLAISSIDYIRLVVSIEELFSIEFEDEMLIQKTDTTPQTLAAYVEHLLRTDYT